MNENQGWQLVAKALAGEATEEEQKALQDIFESNPEMQQTYFYLQQLKANVGDRNAYLNEEEVEKAEAIGLLKMEKLLSVDPPRRSSTTVKKMPWYRKRNPITVAASLLAIIGLTVAFLLFQNAPTKHIAKSQPPATKSILATKAVVVDLKDGTKVWLNKGSKLTYNKAFNKENREVYLEGEGYFDVAKNAADPFVVHIKEGINIKVLGTQFNVKAYPETPFVEASLLSGKIAIDVEGKVQKHIVMEPHQKVTINLEQLKAGQEEEASIDKVVQMDRLKLNPIDQKIPETAWMENRLSFYDMSFKELSYELERIYGKKIIFENNRLENYHLTGSFTKESLEQILEALQITTPFDYKMTEEHVILFIK